MHLFRKAAKYITRTLGKSESIAFLLITLYLGFGISYLLGRDVFFNASLVLDLAAFGILILLIMSTSVSLIHGRNSQLFDKKKQLIILLFTNPRKSEKTISIVAETLNIFSLLLVGIIPAISSLWIVDIFQLEGAWVLFGLYFFEISYFFRRKWKQLIIIYPIFLGPVVPILLRGDYIIPSLFMGFISGILIVYFWREGRKKQNNTVSPKSVVALYSTLNDLTSYLHLNIFQQKSTAIFQSLLIAICLFVLIIVPRIEFLFPQSFTLQIEPFLDYIPVVKEKQTYFLFFFYCGFLIYPLLEEVHSRLRLRRFSNFGSQFINGVIFILITLTIGQFILFPILALILLSLNFGEFLIGKDFTIIIGFFAFQAFGPYLYTFMYLLVLFLIPEWALIRVVGHSK